MPVNGRRKGSSYEREICHAITAATGDKVERILGQARDGGGDIHWREWLLECKRRKGLSTIYRWIAQAKAAFARTEHDYYAVVCRADGEQSFVILDLDTFFDLAQRKPNEVTTRLTPADWQEDHGDVS